MSENFGKITYSVDANLSPVNQKIELLEQHLKGLMGQFKKSLSPEEARKLEKEIKGVNSELVKLKGKAEQSKIDEAFKAGKQAAQQAEKATKDFGDQLGRVSRNDHKLGELRTGFRGIGQDIASSLPGVGQFSELLGGLGPLATGVVAGLAALAIGVKKFYDAVSEGLDSLENLEYRIAQVATLLNEEQEAKFLDKYKEQLQELSQQSGGSFDNLTKGLYDLISAGVPAENAMKTLGAATKAATAGATDVSVAVDGLTSVVNAFAEQGLTAEHASDVFFQTIKDGKTTFQELSGQIGQVAPMAAALGVSFEDVGAAYAEMTKQGINTAQATTALNQMLTSFSSPAVIKKFKNLGIELIDATTGQLNNLGEIMTQVMEKELTAVEVSELMPSVDATKAFLNLTKAAKTAGGEVVSNLEKELQNFDASNLTGATNEAYTDMAETVRMENKRIEQSYEVMLQNVAEGFKPLEQEWLKIKSALIQGVSDFFSGPGAQISEMVINLYEHLKSIGTLLYETFNFLGGDTVLSNLGDYISQIFTTLGDLYNIVTSIFNKISGWMGGEANLLTNTFDMLAEVITLPFTIITKILEGISTGIHWIEDLFGLSDTFKEINKEINDINKNLETHATKAQNIETIWKKVNSAIENQGNLKDLMQELGQVAPEAAANLRKMTDESGRFAGNQAEVNKIFRQAIDYNKELAKGEAVKQLQRQADLVDQVTDDIVGWTEYEEQKQINYARSTNNLKENVKLVDEIKQKYKLSNQLIGKQDILLQKIRVTQEKAENGSISFAEAQKHITGYVKEYKQITDGLDPLIDNVVDGTITWSEATKVLTNNSEDLKEQQIATNRLMEQKLERELKKAKEIAELREQEIQDLSKKTGISEETITGMEYQGDLYEKLRQAAYDVNKPELERLKIQKEILEAQKKEIQAKSDTARAIYAQSSELVRSGLDRIARVQGYENALDIIQSKETQYVSDITQNINNLQSRIDALSDSALDDTGGGGSGGVSGGETTLQRQKRLANEYEEIYAKMNEDSLERIENEQQLNDLYETQIQNLDTIANEWGGSGSLEGADLLNDEDILEKAKIEFPLEVNGVKVRTEIEAIVEYAKKKYKEQYDAQMEMLKAQDETPDDSTIGEKQLALLDDLVKKYKEYADEKISDLEKENELYEKNKLAIEELTKAYEDTGGQGTISFGDMDLTPEQQAYVEYLRKQGINDIETFMKKAMALEEERHQNAVQNIRNEKDAYESKLNDLEEQIEKQEQLNEIEEQIAELAEENPTYTKNQLDLEKEVLEYKYKLERQNEELAEGERLTVEQIENLVNKQRELLELKQETEEIDQQKRADLATIASLEEQFKNIEDSTGLSEEQKETQQEAIELQIQQAKARARNREELERYRQELNKYFYDQDQINNMVEARAAILEDQVNDMARTDTLDTSDNLDNEINKFNEINDQLDHRLSNYREEKDELTDIEKLTDKLNDLVLEGEITQEQKNKLLEKQKDLIKAIADEEARIEAERLQTKVNDAIAQVNAMTISFDDNLTTAKRLEKKYDDMVNNLTELQTQVGYNTDAYHELSDAIDDVNEKKEAEKRAMEEEREDWLADYEKQLEDRKKLEELERKLEKEKSKPREERDTEDILEAELAVGRERVRQQREDVYDRVYEKLIDLGESVERARATAERLSKLAVEDFSIQEASDSIEEDTEDDTEEDTKEYSPYETKDTPDGRKAQFDQWSDFFNRVNEKGEEELAPLFNGEALSFWSDEFLDMLPGLVNEMGQKLASEMGNMFGTLIDGGSVEAEQVGEMLGGALADGVTAVLAAYAGPLGAIVGSLLGPVIEEGFGELFDALFGGDEEEEERQRNIARLKKQITQLQASSQQLKDEWEAIKAAWFETPDFSNLFDTAREELGLLTKEMEHYTHLYQVGYRTEQERLDFILTTRKRMAVLQAEMTRLAAQNSSKAEEGRLAAELEFNTLKQQVESEEQMLEYAKQQKDLQVQITHERMKQLEFQEELGDRTEETMSAQLEESFNVLKNSIQEGLGSDEINKNLSDFSAKIKEAWLEGIISQEELDRYQEQLNQMDSANKETLKNLGQQYRDYRKERNQALFGAWLQTGQMGISREQFDSDLEEFKNKSIGELKKLIDDVQKDLDTDLAGSNVFGYEFEPDTLEAYLQLIAKAELARRGLEDTNESIKDTEEMLFDASLAADMFGMTVDEAIRGELNALDRSIEKRKAQKSLIEKQIANLETEMNLLEQQGKDTTAIQNKINKLKADASAEQDKITKDYEKQIDLIDQLIAYMNERDFIDSDIHEWEIRRLSLQEQLLDSQKKQTKEMEDQKDLNDQMDAQLREMLKLRQNIELQAVEQGWTPDLLRRFQGISGQIAVRMDELGYDTASIAAETNRQEIPAFQGGGYTGNYEGLAMLHPDELIIPHFSNIMKDVALPNTPKNNNISSNVNINIPVNIEGSVDQQTLDQFKMMLQNEAVPIVQEALNKKGMNFSRIM
ncbi:phage tail tape measure protein [Candidatus Dojkabacteria bacterium]|nr:phage tail tape measure protein [Candidatus Dojkabacteria bacterium]